MRSTLLALICGSLIVTIAMGVRQSFGLFLRPLSVDLNTGREVFGFAMGLQNLVFGLAQPFVGMINDRLGAGWIVAAGTALYVVGLLLATTVAGVLGLQISLGLLVGLALSGTTFVVVLGAVGRMVPLEKRAQAFAIITMAGSFGMFVIPPAVAGLMAASGWQSTLVTLAGLAALMAVLGLGISGRPAASASGAAEQSIGQALSEAGGHSGYWLLNLGFFVCGFHIAFIATHLPSFLTDRGIPPQVGGWTLALIGFFNIIGSYAFGVLGARWRKRYVLAVLYFARAVVIGLFLMVPLSTTSALLFAAAMGFLWLGTVPLTSGLVAQVFGVRYMSTLYGIVFLSHQLGSFLGAWLGGSVYDWTGSYDAVWLAAIALGLLAALVHLPIADAPVRRLERQAP